MKRVLLLALCVWAAFSAFAAADQKLVVGFKNVAEPDAALEAFIGDLRRAIMSAKVRDYTVFDAFFAPEILVFHRGLDPLQPWNAAEPITHSPLTRLADALVERKPPVEGKPRTNDREGALLAILQIIRTRIPRGTMKDVPGAVCAPAEYDFDHQAALAFAGKFERDLRDLRFFDTILYLLTAPGSRKGNFIPSNTLVIPDHDPLAPPGWQRYKTAEGLSGYVQERLHPHALAQHHLCFSKVNGEYRITAVFGHGL